jgi:hypothetical protein
MDARENNIIWTCHWCAKYFPTALSQGLESASFDVGRFSKKVPIRQIVQSLIRFITVFHRVNSRKALVSCPISNKYRHVPEPKGHPTFKHLRATVFLTTRFHCGDKTSKRGFVPNQPGTQPNQERTITTLKLVSQHNLVIVHLRLLDNTYAGFPPNDHPQQPRQLPDTYSTGKQNTAAAVACSALILIMVSLGLGRGLSQG